MRGPIVVQSHRTVRVSRRRFLGLAAAAILWPAAAAAFQAPPPNTDELPLASDTEALALLVDMQAVAPTIVVDARYHGSDNFTGAPLPGYEANRVLLRREVAAALARVQDGLARRGLGLKVWDGYRPVRATLWMVEWAEGSGNAWLLEQEYIARRSRHNLGVAVDLTLISLKSGVELDMGTPFDEFSERAHTANAEGAVLANRRLLVEAMEAEGFQNYDQEWWHFSFDVPGALPFDLPIR